IKAYESFALESGAIRRAPKGFVITSSMIHITPETVDAYIKALTEYLASDEAGSNQLSAFQKQLVGNMSARRALQQVARVLNAPDDEYPPGSDEYPPVPDTVDAEFEDANDAEGEEEQEEEEQEEEF